MTLLTAVVGTKASVGLATAITIIGGIVVWAIWPEEKERMKKLSDKRKHTVES